MRKALPLLLAAGLVATFSIARPPTEFPLYLQLNGQPTRLGALQLSTDGGSQNNATTFVPFTVTGGSVVRMWCSAAACICPAGECSCTMAGDAGTADGGLLRNFTGEPVTAGQVRYYVLKDNQTQVSAVMALGSAGDCVVQKME